MEPVIPVASATVVDPKEPYKPGDVIAFEEKGRIITHRLLSIDTKGAITTKGDANQAVDPWSLTKANVIGKVVAAPQKVGWLIMFLKQPTGIMSLAFGVITIWMTIDLCFGRGEQPDPQQPKAASDSSPDSNVDCSGMGGPANCSNTGFASNHKEHRWIH